MPMKHEEAKLEPTAAPPPVPPASGISTDALNRLIAMGGPAGKHPHLAHVAC